MAFMPNPEDFGRTAKLLQRSLAIAYLGRDETRNLFDTILGRLSLMSRKQPVATAACAALVSAFATNSTTAFVAGFVLIIGLSRSRTAELHAAVEESS